LVIILLLYTARLRTLWLISGGSNGVTGVSTAAFITKLLLLAVESSSKTTHLISEGDETTAYRRHEDHAGFFSRTCLLWLNPLFRRGYRESLLADHLDELDSDLASEDLTDVLYGKWKIVKPKRHRRLAIALMLTSHTHFCSSRCLVLP
jgi:ATP-binding cassette, subfamily C (CFTR/MRP), member 1